MEPSKTTQTEITHPNKTQAEWHLVQKRKRRRNNKFFRPNQHPNQNSNHPNQNANQHYNQPKVGSRISTKPSVSMRELDGHFSRKLNIHPKKTRRWWVDPKTGIHIAGAGILITETRPPGLGGFGVWLVEEISRKTSAGIEYSDIGGKYDWNDAHPASTIQREFGEEVYFTDELSRKKILEFMNNDQNQYTSEEAFVHVTSNGHYLCLVLDRKFLPSVQLSDANVKEARLKVLRENPSTQPNMFRTVGLRWFSETDLVAEHQKKHIAQRVRHVLNNPLVASRFSPEVRLALSQPKPAQIIPVKTKSEPIESEQQTNHRLLSRVNTEETENKTEI